MEEIAISEFEANCSAILERVQLTKTPIRVTRFGKPVAEIVPPAAVMDRAKWIGSMKDSIKITGDIVSPANEEDEWRFSGIEPPARHTSGFGFFRNPRQDQSRGQGQPRFFNSRARALVRGLPTRASH